MVNTNVKSLTDSKPRWRARVGALAAFGLLAATLSGCVVYPNGGYYGGGYGYAPSYYAPPVALNFGFGGGYGRWHDHDWR